jgi:hypothetical protein
VTEQDRVRAVGSERAPRLIGDLHSVEHVSTIERETAFESEEVTPA